MGNRLVAALLGVVLIQCGAAGSGTSLDARPNAFLLLALLAQSAGTGTDRLLAFTDSSEVYESGPGSAWTRLTHTGPSRIASAALSDGSLLALDGVSAGLIWRSSDGGRAWTSEALPTPDVATRIAACGSRVVVAHGSSTFVSASENGGATWGSSFIGGPGAVTDLICADTIFYAARNGFPTLLLSYNTGLSWSAAGNATFPTHFARHRDGGVRIVHFYGNPVSYAEVERGTGTLLSSGLLPPIVASIAAVELDFELVALGHGSGACTLLVQTSALTSWSWLGATACPVTTTLHSAAATTERQVFGGGADGLPILFENRGDYYPQQASLPTPAAATKITEIVTLPE